MDIKELLEIIRRGEGERVEFKRDLSEKGGDKLAEVMTAFANTSGGYLIVGVEDELGPGGGLDIRGVKSEDAVQRSLATDARQKCRPPLHPVFSSVDIDGAKVVVARIEPSKETYHFVNARVYVRVGATNQQITEPTELERMRKRLPIAAANGDGSFYVPPPEPFAFAGRDREMGTLRDFVGGKKAVLAIEGISGIGKTALASKLAHIAGNAGYSAFWQVCHTLTTLESVLSNLSAFSRLRDDLELARVLDEPWQGLDDRLLHVAACISDRQLLLILDDFQFVKDEGIRRLILRLDERGGTAKVVMTVRSRPSLLNSCQRAEELQVLSGLDSAACGAFLAERGVVVDCAETLERVWEITGEGHPKALQLLAARTRSYPLEHLLTTLPVFADDMKSEWLAPLLAELPATERAALMDFCVFSRFLPLRSLTAACPDSHYQECFIALADRFIVDPARPDAPQVHQLIRDYCIAVIDSIEEKHEWAAQVYLGECGDTDPFEVLDPIQRESLLAAWEHFVLSGDHEAASKVVRSLRASLTIRGELDQLMLLLERTLPSAEHKDWFEVDKARILDLWGASEEAIALIEPLIESRDARVAREAILVLATIYLDRGRAEEADALLAKHWNRFVKRVGPLVMTRFLSRFVEVQLQLGHLDRAVELSTEIRQISTVNRDSVGSARALRYMGMAFMRRGEKELPQALEMLRASEELLTSSGRLREAAISERQVALALKAMGQSAASTMHLKHALETFATTGDRQNIQLCQSDLASLQVA